jgi:hypothetical protein
MLSMYLLAINQSVEKFPYSVSDLRRDNPDTSFPAIPNDDWLAEWNVFPVDDLPVPVYDPDTESIERSGPTLENDKWILAWQVRPATQEEIAQRLEAKRRSMIVTPFQAKAALLDAGLLDDIEALIADPDADRKVVLAWTNAISFERLSPMVAGIAAALGWTDTQLDDLFDAAAQIA